MAVPGSTSVWNSPSTSPPRTLTAPISVIALSFGEPPVVSRSTTTKVTPDSGVPRSSMVACWYLTPAAADPGGAPGPATGGRSGADTGGADRNGTVRNATVRTLGAGSDSPREARGAGSPAAPGRRASRAAPAELSVVPPTV